MLNNFNMDILLFFDEINLVYITVIENVDLTKGHCNIKGPNLSFNICKSIYSPFKQL